jgi:hypothetical protein
MNEFIKIPVMIAHNHLIVDCIFLMWFLYYVYINNTFGNMQWLCSNILTAPLTPCLAAELLKAMVGLGNIRPWAPFTFFFFLKKRLQFDISKKIFTSRNVRRSDKH